MHPGQREAAVLDREHLVPAAFGVGVEMGDRGGADRRSHRGAQYLDTGPDVDDQDVGVVSHRLGPGRTDRRGPHRRKGTGGVRAAGHDGDILLTRPPGNGDRRGADHVV